MKDVFDRTLLRFLLVGVCNTICSAAIMFLLYELAGLGYWGSSAVAYALASILSFLLNRSYTFQSKGPLMRTALRFATNVAVCYLIAYSLAQPLVGWGLGRAGLTQAVVDRATMLFGMCLFTGLNYLGQRFFAFREKR